MPLPVLSLARTVVERSYEASSVDIEDYAAAVINDYVDSQKEQDRRAEIQLRLDLYRDAWKEALQTLLSATTHSRVYQEVCKVGDLSRNPAKRIWSELAVLYTAAPRRWTDPSEDGERYLDIQKQAIYTPFSTFWPDIEELLQACNEVLIWPEVVELPDGTKLPQNRYCCGNAFSIVWSTEVKGLMECVVELDERVDPGGKRETIYHLWTDEWYAAFRHGEDKKLERVDQVSEAGPTNPYKRLPHWLIRRRSWQDMDLDAQSGYDLVRGTLAGGVAQQLFRYHQKMSGFKQAAVTGLDIEELPQQLLDPGEVFRVLGHDVDLDIIDWQLALKEQQDVLDTDELRLAASRGINPESYKRTANYQTSLGAAMSERPLEYLRTRMVPAFDLAELMYYKSCCDVWDRHGIKDTPDAEAKFEVEHAPMKAPEDPEKQLNIEAKELSMMIIDEIGLLKRRRPDLTDEEAKAEIERIAGNIAAVQKIRVTHNIPKDKTNESLSAEEQGEEGPIVRDAKGKPPGSPPGEASQGE